MLAFGCCVIVKAQGGYTQSSVLRGIGSCSHTVLVSDGISNVCDPDLRPILLAGHDWGAAVAWSAALSHPERIAKLAILNVPHPSVMRRFLMSNRRQMRRSWHMFFFHMPFLPEALFSAKHFRLAASALAHSSPP